MIVIALNAILAVIAWAGRGHRYQITCFKAWIFAACLSYNTGDFVPEDHGFLQRDGAETTVIVVVKV